jgi:hypothetical protein
MTCTPRRPCGSDDQLLGVVPPPPGLPRLQRRLGDFEAFLGALVRDVEQQRLPGATGVLGREWDLAGDPRALQLARSWAFVAEGVAAYTELTAGEAYLGTAQDWTDLRRIAALVGHRPRPGVAAQGWVRFDTDRGAAPLVPAGTRVQAPSVPGIREGQTFEAVADTQLRADWAGLTATPLPVPAVPRGRDLRFLQDPGFRPGDRVLFLLEEPSFGTPVLSDVGWFPYWAWLIALAASQVAPASSRPVALAVVEGRAVDLGTTVVTFDRDLRTLLTDPSRPYAAYRVASQAGTARRITKVLKLGPTDTYVDLRPGYASGVVASGANFIVLDALLSDTSAGQPVALVDWASSRCDVAGVQSHQPIEWEVAPGAPTRLSKLTFASDVPTLAAAAVGSVTAYVVDRRVIARHYDIPSTQSPTRVRVFPAPSAPPHRLAIRSMPPGQQAVWESFACVPAATQEATTDPTAPRGLILDLTGGAPAGVVDREPATGNVVRVRHGESGATTLGSGNATVANQELEVPSAPVAHDLGADGTPVSSLQVRVDGLLWSETPTHFEAGPTDVYVAVLRPDGSVTVRFGDGQQGNRLPTGRDNVTGTYRTGGGTVGEVPAGAIESLIGSIRGVRGVAGVGPVAGGADQDDERRIRELASARARAFQRVVSRGDLVDLAVGFPGVSHAAAWVGVGPPGCACRGSGLHVAFLRRRTVGPQAPVVQEVADLATYLDARRDTAVPLCVAAAVVSPVLVMATLGVDQRRVPAEVAAAARVALLGQALDRSDVVVVLHGAAGVVGIPSLTISGGLQASPATAGRTAARGYELLVVAPNSTVTAVPA